MEDMYFLCTIDELSFPSISIFSFLLYSMAQQPLKSFHCPVMRVPSSNSVTFIFYQRQSDELTRQELRYYQNLNTPIKFCSEAASSFISQYLLVSPINKELCYSSSYSFHFYHLFSNGIVKMAISSQNMSNWLLYVGYYLEVSSSFIFIIIITM